MTDMQCLNLLAPIAMEERTVSALVSSGVCRTCLCSPVYAHGFEHFDLDDDGGLAGGIAALAKAIVPAERMEELLKHLQFELALTGVRFWISPVIRQGEFA